MTRRRVGGRLRVDGLDASDFILGDGVRRGWDSDEVVESWAAAAAQWDRCRVETWQLWARRPVPWPPRGAEVHDGLQRLSDIEGFRDRFPRAAASIAEYLELWALTVERTKQQDAADREAHRAWMAEALEREDLERLRREGHHRSADARDPVHRDDQTDEQPNEEIWTDDYEPE